MSLDIIAIRAIHIRRVEASSPVTRDSYHLKPSPYSSQRPTLPLKLLSFLALHLIAMAIYTISQCSSIPSDGCCDQKHIVVMDGGYLAKAPTHWWCVSLKVHVVKTNNFRAGATSTCVLLSRYLTPLTISNHTCQNAVSVRLDAYYCRASCLHQLRPSHVPGMQVLLRTSNTVSCPDHVCR